MAPINEVRRDRNSLAYGMLLTSFKVQIGPGTFAPDPRIFSEIINQLFLFDNFNLDPSTYYARSG